jgi:hypothetical protein
MQPTFCQTYYIGGTWSASHTIIFKAPFDMQLVHVSAANTSANAGTVKIGTAADDDAYLAAKSFGVSSAAVEYDRDDFIGGQFAHIPDGTTVVVTLSDHASHMANASVVLTFTEG